MTTSLLMSKMSDITAARRRDYKQQRVMGMNDHEKRRDDRRTSNDRLFIQIVSSDDPDLMGTTISCEAVDVSASGLRIATRIEIPAGCQLDVWIDDSAGPGKYFLSSDVRWSRRAGDLYQAGLELHDGSAT
ncbi:MAG: PilZ domain-containing protein, partial [Pseudomonadales bacterium]